MTTRFVITHDPQPATPPQNSKTHSGVLAESGAGPGVEGKCREVSKSGPSHCSDEGLRATFADLLDLLTRQLDRLLRLAEASRP